MVQIRENSLLYLTENNTNINHSFLSDGRLNSENFYPRLLMRAKVVLNCVASFDDKQICYCKYQLMPMINFLGFVLTGENMGKLLFVKEY